MLPTQHLSILKKCTFFALITMSMMLKSNFGFTQTLNSLKIQSTAVPFMMISPDARSGGMGNLSLGMSAEPNDMFGNTAKLPLLEEKRGFLINYTPWLKDLGLNDVYLASAGYYKKLNDRSALNSSLRFFSLGNIQFSDINGTPTTEQKPSEFSYDLGYNFLITDNLSAGITLRYIHSKLVTGSFIGSAVDYRAGNTVSGDLSFYYQQNENSEGFHAGLLLSNLGGKISYTNETNRKFYIPANLGLGVGYKTIFDGDNSLEVGADINRLMVPAAPNVNDPNYATLLDKYYSQSVISSWFSSFGKDFGLPLGESIKISLGSEYNYTNRFFLRAGYFVDNNKNLGNMQYFTFGSAFKYQDYRFNISYLVPSGGGLTKNPLSNTLRFGTIFYF